MSSSLLIHSSALSTLLLNPSSLLFSSVMLFFISVTSIWYLLIFSVSFFVEVPPLLIPSSPEFGEHLYDHYFELFIRKITYLYFIKVCLFVCFPEVLPCSFACIIFLFFSLCLTEFTSVYQVLKEWPCTGGD